MRTALLPVTVLFVLVPPVAAAEVNVSVADARDVSVSAEQVGDGVWRVWVQNRGSVAVTGRPYIDMLGPVRIGAGKRTVAPGELVHVPVAAPYPGLVGAVGFGDVGIVTDTGIRSRNRSSAVIPVIRVYPHRVRVVARVPDGTGDVLVSVNRSRHAIRQHHVADASTRAVLDHRMQSAITGRTSVTVAVTDAETGETATRTVSRVPLRGVAASFWNAVEGARSLLDTYVFFM